MKTLRIFAALVLFTAFAASCSSDDNNEETPALPQTRLISKETKGNSDGSGAITVNEYGFDAANRVVSALTPNDARSYIWDNQGRIGKVEYEAGPATRIENYYYNAQGKLESMERKLNATVEFRRMFTYFSDRFEEKYYNTDNDLLYRYVSYYSADGKNIRERKVYWGDGSFKDSQTFTYDNNIGVDQIAPFSNIPAPFHNTNNIVQLQHFDVNGNAIGNRDYNYTFDAFGYPVSEEDVESATTRDFEYTLR